MPTDKLLSRAEIAALTDTSALKAVAEDVEADITQIETQLEFSDRDEDWRRRAIAALAHRRASLRQIQRRMADLQSQEAKAPLAPPHRPAEDCHPLTLEVRRSRPSIDVDAVATTAEADQRMAWLVERINAVEEDRNQEIAVAAQERDEAFMAWSGSALREMRWQRQTLQVRRAELARAEKAARLLTRDATRERLFIEAARETLSKDAFLALWATVDQREAQASLHGA